MCKGLASLYSYSSMWLSYLVPCHPSRYHPFQPSCPNACESPLFIPCHANPIQSYPFPCRRHPSHSIYLAVSHCTPSHAFKYPRRIDTRVAHPPIPTPSRSPAIRENHIVTIREQDNACKRNKSKNGTKPKYEVAQIENGREVCGM